MEDDDSIAASPMDWDAYEWSEEARGRKGSLLQDIMARFASMPGTIPMHGGLPPADAFPFTSLSFALAPAAGGGGGGGGGAGAGAARGGEPTARNGGRAPAAAAKDIPVVGATPSPDHRAPKDHGRRGSAVAAVAVTATAVASDKSKCRCNAAHASCPDANDAAATTTTTATLTIDDPLAVATAQQYNIGSYGQQGLRAWAARATAELQRPAPIAGSAAWWARTQRRRRSPAAASSAAASSPPPPPPPPPPGPPLAAVQRPLHDGGRDLVVTAGSTAALDAALRALLSRGDALLAEEFTYSHALEALMAPHGYRLMPVRMDRGQGLCPKALDAAAEAEARRPGSRGPPKVLYTIPVGQNPTGCVAGYERLRAVYAVARKWGMVVIEDDAYCWLRLRGDDGAADASGGQPAAAAAAAAAALAPAQPCPSPSSAAQPLLPRPGLLSLDADGRVLRLDTFAKLLAPGLRLGWATGPARLVRVLAEATMAATVGPPALSQAVASGLLQRWGCCCCVLEQPGPEELQEEGEEEEQEDGAMMMAAGGGDANNEGASPRHAAPDNRGRPSAIGPGFRSYLAALQRRYAVQADQAARCAARHLAGVAEFEPPRAGMFLWVRLLPVVPAGGGDGVVDGDRVVGRAADLGVAVVPGRIFAVESYVDGGGGGVGGKPCPYLRVSFVNTPADLFDEGLRRLRQAIDDERAEMMMTMMATAAAA